MTDPNQIIRSRISPNARRGVIRALGAVLALALLTGPTHAQLSVMRTMEDLACVADVIVSATRRDDGRYRITSVMAGRELEVGATIALPHFEERFITRHARCPDDPDRPVVIGRDVVLLLSQSQGEWVVTGHGAFTHATICGQTGYFGFDIGGTRRRVSLSPQIAFRTLDDITAQVGTWRATLPERQRAALARVRASSRMSVDLQHLAAVTHVGDREIIEAVVALAMESDPPAIRERELIQFLQRVGDPDTAHHLETLYHRHPDPRTLDAIGDLGNPRSHDLFRALLQDDDDTHHRAAIEALGRLNLRLRARGDHDACAQIRETIFAYYAFEITLLDRLRQSHVALTTIPHDGAIRRLRVLHDHLAHRPGQREVEIARAIAALEAQLAAASAPPPPP